MYDPEFVTLAIRKSDREILKQIAKKEKRSMAQQVSCWIEKYLEAKQDEP